MNNLAQCPICGFIGAAKDCAARLGALPLGHLFVASYLTGAKFNGDRDALCGTHREIADSAVQFVEPRPGELPS